MRLRFLVLFLLLVLCSGGVATAATSSTSKAASSGPKRFVDGTLDTGQYLPDTFTICRVGKRVTPVKEYVRAYFDSYAEDRPAPDSAGRVQFLESVVNKEILGQVALAISRPMNFEDRVLLRDHEQRTLANALYRTAVLDSVVVSEDDLQHEFETYRYDVRIRHIQFPNLATAERVRLDLKSGRITWKDAYTRYSISKSTDKKPEGETGWVARGGVGLDAGRKVFRLGPGGISEPIQQDDTWVIVQVIERRDGTPPALESVRSLLTSEIQNERVAARSGVIRDIVRREISMVYDTSQITWAAKYFTPTQTTSLDDRGMNQINFNTTLPEFSMSDTSRVLARYRDGTYTLGRFMHEYSDIQPLVRPSIDSPEALTSQIDGFVFEPYMAEVAKARGLDRDSAVVASMANKREEILVEHLYADSVQAYVSVSSKDRKKYYQDHLRGFVTWSRVRYAALWAASRGEADTLAARLKAGEKAEDIIAADSLVGIKRGSIQERAENEHGPYQKLLFEMLRPGQISIEGPDKEKSYLVLQELAYIPGRQLSYEEAEAMIDESLQNSESERLLKALIKRHRGEFQIRSRPDLVMRVRLVDPSL